MYICRVKKIKAYKDYYKRFMESLSERDRNKVLRSLLLFETEDRIPSHFISYIEQGIYEFRVTCSDRKEIRIFFIYDSDGTIVVILLNAFLKKTQKTPRSEIEKAIKLKSEYYEERE